DDVPADGRADGQVGNRLAGALDGIDLVLVDTPQAQAIPGQALEVAVAAAAGVQQVLDGDHQVGAVQLGQGLALLDRLAGDVDVELVDAALARGPGADAGQLALVELHEANGADLLDQGL